MQTVEAEILGETAFEEGIACAPVLDVIFMMRLNQFKTENPNVEFSVVQKLYQAWAKGWTEANLAKGLKKWLGK